MTISRQFGCRYKPCNLWGFLFEIWISRQSFRGNRVDLILKIRQSYIFLYTMQFAENKRFQTHSVHKIRHKKAKKILRNEKNTFGLQC